MHTNADLRPLHRIAILASVDVVSTVTIKDLARVTPCADWRLADLLTHMTAQHLGFAAAARGHGADPAIWQPATVADAVAADPAGSYAAAAAQVIDAFAGLDELDALFALPEFGPGATFPGSMAIGFHFVDYVVHGWDVARTMGHPFELPPDVVAAVLPIALAVPDAEFRAADNAPFGPSIQARDQSNDLDRILAYLGRSPKWTPTGSGLTRRN
ncbi:MAG: TIGR03086 family metal-binding protein [Mycobacterium sp.]|uniref:TIGR03086 family metal-binding protein n=1 Tax=Mycobacterium sp. TaxID=1785 RepID=UPI003BB68A06